MAKSENSTYKIYFDFHVYIKIKLYSPFKKQESLSAVTLLWTTLRILVFNVFNGGMHVSVIA